MWFDSKMLSEQYGKQLALLFPYAPPANRKLAEDWLQQTLDLQQQWVSRWPTALWWPWLAQPPSLKPPAPAKHALKQLATATSTKSAAAAKTPAVKKTPPAKPLPAQDLTAISGVGPALAKKLAAAGIHNYAQIAAWTEQDIERIESDVIGGSLKGRIVRDDWVGQAKALAQ